MTPTPVTAIAPRAAGPPLGALGAGAQQRYRLGPLSARLVVEPGLLRSP
ncbi:hypothetical protein [Streptomyces sp. NPDC092903]